MGFRPALLIIFIALSASSCRLQLLSTAGKSGEGTEGTRTSAASVAFTGPTANSWVNAATASSVTLTGSCSDEGELVSFSGATTAGTVCASGAFSASVDVSAASDGPITIYVDHASAPQAALVLRKDVQAPNTPSYVNPAGALALGTTAYSFSWTSSDLGPSGLALANTYSIERFANGTCAGAPAATSASTAANYLYSSLVNGTSYSIRVTASDEAGNASSAPCSSAVAVDTSAPTLAISDSVSSDASYATQTTLSAAIGNDGVAARWCLSESQTTAPVSGAAACTGGAGPSSGWYTARPTGFVLPAGQGARTLHLWVADTSGNVVAQNVFDSIVLDTVKPTITYSAVNPASPTSQTTQTLGGTCSDATSGIPAGGILICIKSTGTCHFPADYTLTANCSSGSWSYSASMTDGLYDIEAIATDAAGWESASAQGQGAQNYRVDTSAPVLGTWTAPTATTYITANNYTFSWNAATDAGSGLHATQPYFVELFANGTCSGSAASSAWQTGTTINYASLSVGSSYSARISAKNAAGSVSGTSCSSPVTRVTTGFTWIGAGADANWSTAANWSGGAAPGASDIAAFDGACQSNCSPTIDAPINVGGIGTNGGYSGTITQGAGATITVGSAGWTHNRGTFLGGSSAITVNGPMSLGGAFTSTSGTMIVQGDLTRIGSGSFTHNNGKVQFGACGSAEGDSELTVDSITFYDVRFCKDGRDVTSHTDVVVAHTTDVDIANGGWLYIDYPYKLEARGNMNATTCGLITFATFTSNGAQNLDATVNCYFIGVEVNKSGGSLSLAGVGSSRVDLQACKLEYSIVSPK